MFSLKDFYNEYETEANELAVNGRKFTILLPKNLFQLKPGGEVILAGEMRKLSKEFYKALEQMFDIRVLKKILRSDNEKINSSVSCKISL